MRTVIKLILSIVLFIICIPLSAVAGAENPTLKVIVMAGLVGGLIAIWRYKPSEDNQNNNEDNDKHMLDKTN